MFFLWIRYHVNDVIILTSERLTINRNGREYIIIEYDYDIKDVVVRISPHWKGHLRNELYDISGLMEEYQKYLDSMK